MSHTLIRRTPATVGARSTAVGIAGGVWRKALVMEGHLEETLAVLKQGATRSREWMHRVITVLEAAIGQLHDQEHPVQGTLLEAAALLRQQVHPQAAGKVPYGRGRLLARQARKMRDYIDSQITEPVLVADLCALVQRSEAHFSRYIKRTFGESPVSYTHLDVYKRQATAWPGPENAQGFHGQEFRAGTLRRRPKAGRSNHQGQLYVCKAGP